MSFDRLPSLEAQPTTTRRSDDPQYSDDPGFRQLSESLSNQLFTLTSNISRLSNQIALLGTKRDTERVRERVHDLLEETRDGFKDVGEGIKRIQTWEDVSVSLSSKSYLSSCSAGCLRYHRRTWKPFHGTCGAIRTDATKCIALPEIYPTEALPRIQSLARRISGCSTISA